MDIVIISDFPGSFEGKDNDRFVYLINMIKDKHDVELITSDFNHGKKKHFESVPEVDGYKLTMLHELSYPKNVCLKRFRAHKVWADNVIKYLKKRKKPDVVYSAVPPFLAANYVAKYCNKNGIRFIIDVQDLWPEAFQMVFNVPVISSIIFAPFKAIANGVYKRADDIVAVSQTYVDRALSVNKKCKEGHSVFLGTNLSDFDRNVKENPVTTKPSGEIWMGYCGTLGSSYDLTTVFDAMRIIEQKGLKTPKFIVMGKGPREAEFKEKAEGLNVEFTGMLPYARMCGLLAACDFVINPITHNAAQSIINKHADYAAVGLPVINTQECKEYKDLVSDKNMGFNIPNSDAESMAEKIIELCNNPKLRKEMGRNSRLCAEELFDRAKTYGELSDIITEDISLVDKEISSGGGYVIPVKNEDEIWLGYCGSLSNSYDIKTVVDALVLLNDDRLRFIIMGGGVLKKEFEAYAREKNVNADFIGMLPYSMMCGVLSSGDIVVNPIVGRSVASIINKHADYVASGKPVINTQESPEYKKLVEDYHMGFNVENGNALELRDKLSYLISHKEEREEMGKNARRCAEEKFNRENTYKELSALFL